MFELVVVQAAFGDCLVVRYGTRTTRRTVLIDGGPSTTYDDHLRDVLETVADDGGQIDLCVLSHIDNDHVKGLLDLFAALHDAQGADAGDDEQPPSRKLGSISELWHNSFSLSAGGEDIAPRIREALATSGRSATRLRTLAGTLMGVGEGDALRIAAMSLGVPINKRFGGGAVLLDRAGTVRLGGMRIDVVGPSDDILQRLREEWLTWLRRHGRAMAAASMAAAVAADNAIPNLSSIVLLVRARRRSMLLTGDGRGDHIVDGLRQRGLLGRNGKLHVDVLKLPHHGSARNASPEFFRTVTADRYVVSANGRYGNPDLECLLWIIDAAAGRPIELICTNDTDSVRALVQQRPPADAGYRLTIMPPENHGQRVVLD